MDVYPGPATKADRSYRGTSARQARSCSGAEYESDGTTSAEADQDNSAT